MQAILHYFSRRKCKNHKSVQPKKLKYKNKIFLFQSVYSFECLDCLYCLVSPVSRVSRVTTVSNISVIYQKLCSHWSKTLGFQFLPESAQSDGGWFKKPPGILKELLYTRFTLPRYLLKKQPPRRFPEHLAARLAQVPFWSIIKYS
jgi:hypothetical protein